MSVSAMVDGFFHRYAQAWASNDPGQIAHSWDRDGFAFYKAEEVERFFHDFDELLAYWHHNESLHDRVILRFADIHVSSPGEGLLLGTLRMRWDIRFRKDARTLEGASFPHAGKAMGGDNHVLVLLEHSVDRVRLRGWSETPDAPITYLRGLYFAGADQDVLGDA